MASPITHAAVTKATASSSGIFVWLGIYLGPFELLVSIDTRMDEATGGLTLPILFFKQSDYALFSPESSDLLLRLQSQNFQKNVAQRFSFCELYNIVQIALLPLRLLKRGIYAYRAQK